MTTTINLEERPFDADRLNESLSIALDAWEDYTHNFTTIKDFAEHYNIPESIAETVLALGYSVKKNTNIIKNPYVHI